MKLLLCLTLLLSFTLSAQQTRFQFSFEAFASFPFRGISPNAVPLPDGGYAMTESTQRIIPNSSPLQWGEFPVFVRYDHSGNVVNVHQFNHNPINSADIGALIGTRDGGFMFATNILDSATFSQSQTNTVSNATLVKLDSVGNVVWTKAYRPNLFSGASYFSAVRQLPDGGYITGGTIYNLTGIYNAFMMRTDSIGNPLWIKMYGTNSLDILFDLEIMPDGGYVIACHGGTANGTFDALVIRTDSGGTVNWIRQFDAPGIDVAYGVSVCANGDVLMTGLTQDLQFVQIDLIAARFDNNGNVLWCRSYTSPGLPHSGAGIDELYDGSIAVSVSASIFTPQLASTYNPAVGLMRLNSNGDLLQMQILSDSSGGQLYESGKGNDGGIWLQCNRFLVTSASGIINSYPTLIKTDTSLQSGCPQYETVVTERPYIYTLISVINESTRAVSWYDVPDYNKLPFPIQSDTVLCLEKIPAPQAPPLPIVEPISIPNVFTPNGDGINDLFLPTGADSTNYSLHIYNRWGNLLAELENTGWNGRTAQNADAVDGTYYYIMESNGQRYTGFFTLIR
jgi:gliding motility-associated-like protein